MMSVSSLAGDGDQQTKNPVETGGVLVILKGDCLARAKILSPRRDEFFRSESAAAKSHEADADLRDGFCQPATGPYHRSMPCARGVIAFPAPSAGRRRSLARALLDGTAFLTLKKCRPESAAGRENPG